MARIDKLEQLLFPVELRPLYTNTCDDNAGGSIRVPGHMAVFNLRTGRTLGVVGGNYRLVTNEQALSMALQAVTELFGSDAANEIDVFQVDAPASGGHCYIDLIHNNYVMNLWDEQTSEVYLPFVRVTNSYNRTRKLRFDIGFCRKLCFNGCIFEQDTLKYEYQHSRSAIGSTVHFTDARQRFDELFKRFQAYTLELKQQRITAEQALTILLSVLGIRHPVEIDFAAKHEDRDEYDALMASFASIIDGYINELGDNAYALFNAMTDVASHAIDNRYLRREHNSLQRRAGNWVNAFRNHVCLPGFSIDSYVAELNPAAAAAPQSAGTMPGRPLVAVA